MSESAPESSAGQPFWHWPSGDQSAAEIAPQLYDELRRVASRYLQRERKGHTLQPTELVNEAFIRLLGTEASASSRAHFFSLAARSMRRILVDHERRAQAAKRFSPRNRVTLSTGITPEPGMDVEVLSLHQALEKFAEISPRSAHLVELRYFAGLTNCESAEVLGISTATAERDWKSARVWLYSQLRQ